MNLIGAWPTKTLVSLSVFLSTADQQRFLLKKTIQSMYIRDHVQSTLDKKEVCFPSLNERISIKSPKETCQATACHLYSRT